MEKQTEYVYVTADVAEGKLKVKESWMQIKVSGLKPNCKYFVFGYGFDRIAIPVDGKIIIDGPGYCYGQGSVNIEASCGCDFSECWAKITITQ